jgi:hypothetical protein
MNVCAAVIWYDEHPDDLWEMCGSLKGLADTMVALDGAFQNFPGAASRSDPEQAQALVQGCGDNGIELLLSQPVEVGRWLGSYRGEEVAKRNACFRLCGAFLPDWVVVIDADMRVTASDGARDLMEWSDKPVASTNVDGATHRHVFRWSPTLRYFRTHFIAVDRNVMLSGPAKMRPDILAPLPPLAQALDLFGVLKFTQVEKRQPGRRARATAYYQSRDERGVESIGS